MVRVQDIQELYVKASINNARASIQRFREAQLNAHYTENRVIYAIGSRASGSTTTVYNLFNPSKDIYIAPNIHIAKEFNRCIKQRYGLKQDIIYASINSDDYYFRGRRINEDAVVYIDVGAYYAFNKTDDLNKLMQSILVCASGNENNVVFCIT